MLKLIAAAAFAASATVATAAQAPANEVVITVTATDRADAAGQRVLMRKVAMATEQVCGSFATVEYAQWDGVERCRAEAMKSVDQELAAMKAPGTIRLATR